jgi:hypothetical protein
MKKPIGLLFAAMFIGCWIASAIASEVYDFANDYIDALGQLVINHEKSLGLQKESADNPLASAMSASTECRLSGERLKIAAGLLSKYTTSRNELIKQASQTAVLACRRIMADNEQFAEFFERFFKEPGIDEGDLIAELSKRQSGSERMWELLNDCNILACHAFVDRNPDKDGKVGYLFLTSVERRELIQKLDSLYGEPIKDRMKPGLNKLQTCGAELRQVIAGGWKSADEKQLEL